MHYNIEYAWFVGFESFESFEGNDNYEGYEQSNRKSVSTFEFYRLFLVKVMDYVKIYART